MENLVKMRAELEEMKHRLKRMPIGGYYDDRMEKRYLEIEISDLEKQIKVLEKQK